jgi:hypothetical protein
MRERGTLLDDSPKDLLRNENGILSMLWRIALLKVKGDLKTPRKSSLDGIYQSMPGHGKLLEWSIW